MADGEEEICGLLPLKEQLAVVKNNRKMKKWTLRELCLRAVVKDKEIFINLGPTSVHRVQNLPLVLKNDLADMALVTREREILSAAFLNKLMNNPSVLENWCRFVDLLLEHGTKYLDVPACYLWTQRHSIKRLMASVGRKCHDLRFLNTTVRFIWEDEDENGRLWFEPVFFRELPRLSNLQVLDLGSDIFCNDADLQDFAKHTPNLVVLIIHGLDVGVSKVGFEELSKLPFLRKFLFSDSKWAFERKCLQLCAKFLPQLKMVGRNFSSLDRETFDKMGLESYHKPMIQKSQPKPLGLEEIFLRHKVQPHKNCQLPLLRKVFWFEPSGDAVGFCSRFASVTELSFHKADVDVVMQVMEGVGRRLRGLRLTAMPAKLPLSEIVQLCPKLEGLQIELCKFATNCRWPYTNFGNSLEEFALDMNYEPLPTGFISNLLSAPRLKAVVLEETYLSKKEVDALLVLVRQRHILRNIDTMEWCNFFEQDKFQSWMADKDHFDLLLDNIQVVYPNIDTIDQIKKEKEQQAEYIEEYKEEEDDMDEDEEETDEEEEDSDEWEMDQ